jgi:hypothetical protein
MGRNRLWSLVVSRDRRGLILVVDACKEDQKLWWGEQQRGPITGGLANPQMFTYLVHPDNPFALIDPWKN